MPEPDLALDRLIHEPGRLGDPDGPLLGERRDFLFVQRATGLTKGNLSSHLTKLEAAGLVAIEKRFVGRKPNTRLALTDEGRERIARHWEQLRPAQGNSAANEPCASRSSASVALTATRPAVSVSAVPADLAEHLRAERLERLGRTGDDEAPPGDSPKSRVQASPSGAIVTRAPTPPASAALRQRDREAALGDVVRAAQRRPRGRPRGPRRAPSAPPRCRLREPVGQRLAAQLRELRAGAAPGRTGRRARRRRPRRANAEPPARAASGSRRRCPTTGVG